MLPEITKVIDKLINLADKWKDMPLLAETHGQPASPTRTEKGSGFISRLNQQIEQLKLIVLCV